MKKITSKDIKKYILNHNDLDILFEYIDDYYKETLEGILNALFILMKHPERNKEDIENFKNQINLDISSKVDELAAKLDEAKSLMMSNDKEFILPNFQKRKK